MTRIPWLKFSKETELLDCRLHNARILVDGKHLGTRVNFRTPHGSAGQTGAPVGFG